MSTICNYSIYSNVYRLSIITRWCYEIWERIESIDLIRSNFRQAGDEDEEEEEDDENYETNQETATTGRLGKKLPPDLYL